MPQESYTWTELDDMYPVYKTDIHNMQLQGLIDVQANEERHARDMIGLIDGR